MSLTRAEAEQFFLAGMKPVKTPFGRWRQRSLAKHMYQDLVVDLLREPGDFITFEAYNSSIWSVVCQQPGVYKLLSGAVPRDEIM